MKPGEVSDVIQMEQAYTVIRLDAHTMAKKQSFEAVKSASEPKCRRTNTNVFARDWIRGCGPMPGWKCCSATLKIRVEASPTTRATRVDFAESAQAIPIELSQKGSAGKILTVQVQRPSLSSGLACRCKTKQEDAEEFSTLRCVRSRRTRET